MQQERKKNKMKQALQIVGLLAGMWLLWAATAVLLGLIALAVLCSVGAAAITKRW